MYYFPYMYSKVLSEPQDVGTVVTVLSPNDRVCMRAFTSFQTAEEMGMSAAPCNT